MYLHMKYAEKNVKENFVVEILIYVHFFLV